MNLFSDETRRNPYPAYEQIRVHSPLLQDPQTKLWMVFDYDGVKKVLTDHESFSSRLGPVEWMVFLDPPRHTRHRALVAQAFTPRSVANLEPRIRELCDELLRPVLRRGEMDLVADFSAPLPMMVIAEMLGAPAVDRPKFTRWNDILLSMSLTIPGGPNAAGAAEELRAATGEMMEYLTVLLAARRAAPQDDLLTRLAAAELEGEKLTTAEILSFFQLLLLAGSETTTNLVNNAVLSFLENPGELARLRAQPALLPSAIEETLRFRAPLQWMFRVAKNDVSLHGQTIPARAVVLAMMGSANRDPKKFPEPNRFDIGRDPNPHIAFGHGIHFCLGAALARVEARIVLTALLRDLEGIELAGTEPWPPRQGIHVHGPARLPIRFHPKTGA